MSRPSHPSPVHRHQTQHTLPRIDRPENSPSNPPAAMTETQQAPSLPPSFLEPSCRRLPPLPAAHHLTALSAPPAPAPIRPEYAFRSPPTSQVVSPSQQRHPYPYATQRHEPAYSPRSSPATALPPRSAYEGTPAPKTFPKTPSYEERSPVEATQRSLAAPPLPPSHAPPGYQAPSYGPYARPTAEHHAQAAHLAPVPVPPGGVVPNGQMNQPPTPTVIGLPPELDYRLRIRQQPEAARACGFGERDRRNIDPPPIVQLEIINRRTALPDSDEMRNSLFHISCTLWSADGSTNETQLATQDGRSTKRLMGQTVAAACIAKDEHDVEGMFFCFPDLSCRTNGSYRLHFCLIRMDTSNIFTGASFPVAQTVMSDVFQVFTAKDFPGMRASSALTRTLKHQGCNIQVKKGNEKALAARKRPPPVSDDDEISTRRSPAVQEWKRFRD